jgi:hypothetical protein
MSAWSFRRRRGTCSVCEREFDDGEAHFSALAIQGEELSREDACRACWKARDDSLPAPLFWWRTRHHVAARKGLALDLEAIQGLFLGLEGRDEQHLRELRYVLALILLRKRRLKIERIERSDEGESMILRRPRRQEALRVWVFEFDAERMAQLRDELQRVFDAEEGVLAAAGAGGEADAPDGPSSEGLDPAED